MKTERDNHGNIICPECDGKGGYIGYGTADTDEPPTSWEECEYCDGRGYVEFICPFCHEPNDRDEPGNCDVCAHCGPSGI